VHQKIIKCGDISLTVYQGKISKNVLMLNSLYHIVTIGTKGKKNPGSVFYYNKTKYGVEILDKARQHSVKTSSRRWPATKSHKKQDIQKKLQQKLHIGE
jgi:hypothetical protein